MHVYFFLKNPHTDRRIKKGSLCISFLIQKLPSKRGAPKKRGLFENFKQPRFFKGI